MKVRIDQNNCVECGMCEAVCSKVFVLDSGGKAVVLPPYRVSDNDIGEVSPELAECVIEAADKCPVDVIFID